jgi:hypothetical protein
MSSSSGRFLGGMATDHQPDFNGAAGSMPRDGAITFRDIVGKLAVLRITCDKCGRSGQYRVDRLIMRYGIDAKLFDWSDEITADCPRKQARNLSDYSVARATQT